MHAARERVAYRPMSAGDWVPDAEYDIRLDVRHSLYLAALLNKASTDIVVANCCELQRRDHVREALAWVSLKATAAR